MFRTVPVWDLLCSFWFLSGIINENSNIHDRSILLVAGRTQQRLQQILVINIPPPTATCVCIPNGSRRRHHEMRMQQRISWQCLFEVNVHSSLLPFCSSDDWAVRPSSACNSVWPPQFYCIWVALRATTRAYSRKLQQRISHHAVVHIYSSVWNVLKVLHLLSVHMHQRRRSCLWQPWMIRTCTMECTGTTLLVVILVSLMQLIWIHCSLTAFLAWAVTIKCCGVSMKQVSRMLLSMISHGSWGNRYIAAQKVCWSLVTK